MPISLNMILGFAENFRKVVISPKNQLIRRKSNTNLTAVLLLVYKAGSTDTRGEWKIQLMRIEWLMPHVLLFNEYKIHLLDQLLEANLIAMSFRTCMGTFQLANFSHLLETCLVCENIESNRETQFNHSEFLKNRKVSTIIVESAM